MSGSGPYAGNEKCREFVENLVQMRELRGWTQAELAKACLFSTGVIANIEGFQRAPLVDHGQAIDKAFKLKNVFELKAGGFRGSRSRRRSCRFLSMRARRISCTCMSTR